MRASAFFTQLQQQIDEVKAEGLYKSERVITSQQQAQIEVASGDKVINFCANNYLGLANSPELIKAAQQGLDDHGFGVASVRFICGTQDIHKTLEHKISEFLETEDTILYSSCFDANAGLFETILGPDDAIISDALNHASIIDGVRLCKAKRFRYANNDMSDLEKQLIAADEAGAKTKLIATDGVFSMDGVICNLKAVCDLADKYDALVMVDDSHAVGFVGENGKGTPEYCGVLDRVDIITGTLGKALGGASGGYTSGKKEIVEWLRQRSRPYLFSNSLAPSIVTASIKVLEMLSNGGELRAKLWDNAHYFREQMEAAGFTCAGKDHAIIPVMLGDAKVASMMADKLLAEGIYVTGFSFPVVPKGQARIRTQISAAHTKEQLDTAIAAFTRIGKEMGVI
ncbi:MULTISPECIES: glycine C-acetyltransferase [Pseudoalteromonas]|jgi:glycine C-acetyltransferase|uniref:2-amino-3-ketobutyrate coenzyme A ligase n=1 Tax=Pseudoalteromonas lipolytica TaxID=570156 RepID=A0ABY1GHC1_9GAMM|nr:MULTISPECIES: glycine C-acetyltransferase [Pseudoalteromonas]EWH06442.1 2-amino-3-ketobutyrate CoA ligase [Pseudoalteromonas lipolytica SCSIO 04301]MBE0351974.1 glycine C-acetyltransferase [Pseudoalteromonas lipolytica LMEB 39]MCC9661073.1 glycine C-acetyltransferase [Pseudoalteromonas sp. MB41]QMW15062.1 glycine C-acetyltransferase [Pseudoalteromonas sp. MT33b]SFT58910.1 2-amino-3-ketobutyrate coenzyme A ligase [Pseudoalteromonas lipolytica]|tara:strand:+ start:11744 stop:12940 length:1197 start_codon:yes stop_codon:yes gene_type:complete